jgi:C1A family cysteine protease
VYVLKNQGTTTESCSPYYTGQCHNCNENHKIKSQLFIRENNIREFLNKKTAVITYFYVHKNFYDYRSGIYRQTDSNLRGAHAVIIVGYDDTHNYWICKNSWGSWGEGGYFRIKYGEVNIAKYNYVYEMDKPINVSNDTYVPNCCIKNIPNILLILSGIYLFKFV